MHWNGCFEARVSCMLSPAKILWFPGIRFYGESFSFQECVLVFMPGNRTHSPSLRPRLVGKLCAEAAPGRLHGAVAIAQVPSSMLRHTKVPPPTHRGSA